MAENAIDLQGRQAQEQRRAVDELEKILANIHVLVAYLDRDFNFVRVNRAYAAADGHEPDFFVGKNHFALYPNPENEIIFRRVVETGEPCSQFEKAFTYADHPERGVSYWDWSLQPVKDPRGRVEGLVFILTDVTDKVLAKKRLQAQTAYTRSLIESSPDPLVTLGPDGRITDVNAAAEATLGYSRTELVGSDYASYCVDPAQARLGYERVLREGSVRDFPLDMRHRDGHIVVGVYNGSIYQDHEGRIAGVLMTARDVTRRRKAEAERDRLLEELRTRVTELRRQAVQMRRAEELGRLGYWRTDFRTGQMIWSPGAYRLLGLEPGSLTPTLEIFLQRIHPDDRGILLQASSGIMAGDSPRYEVEYRIRRADSGEERNLLARGERERDAEGKLVALFGVTQDVTERKRAEWMLRERFRVMAENIGDVFWASLPGNMEMIYVNPAYERIWGRSRAALYANPESFFMAIHPDDREKVAASMAQHAETEWEIEYRIVRPDGSVRWIHDRRFPLLDEKAHWKVIVGIASDITELKRTEAALKNALDDLRAANHRLEQLSYLDPLTGVANRRFMGRFIEREWPRERRHGHDFAVIMTDIDYFKPYNDFYGHSRGDECLSRVARELAGHLRRPSDIVARFGGEEFVVLLPETDLAGAAKLAEEIRERVAGLRIPHERSPTAPVVTVSLGVASVNARDARFDRLLSLADQALYRAKAAGRNRVAQAAPQAVGAG